MYMYIGMHTSMGTYIHVENTEIFQDRWNQAISLIVQDTVYIPRPDYASGYLGLEVFLGRDGEEGTSSDVQVYQNLTKGGAILGLLLPGNNNHKQNSHITC